MRARGRAARCPEPRQGPSLSLLPPPPSSAPPCSPFPPDARPASRPDTHSRSLARSLAHAARRRVPRPRRVPVFHLLGPRAGLAPRRPRAEALAGPCGLRVLPVSVSPVAPSCQRGSSPWRSPRAPCADTGPFLPLRSSRVRDTHSRAPGPAGFRPWSFGRPPAHLGSPRGPACAAATGAPFPLRAAVWVGG